MKKILNYLSFAIIIAIFIFYDLIMITLPGLSNNITSIYSFIYNIFDFLDLHAGVIIVTAFAAYSIIVVMFFAFSKEKNFQTNS